MYNLLVQYAGFIGVTIVLVAHSLFAFDILSNSIKSIKIYTVISFLGSSLFLFSSIVEEDLVFILLNVLAILIAVLGFFSIKISFPYSVKSVITLFVASSLLLFGFTNKGENLPLEILESFSMTCSFLIVLNFFMYLNGSVSKIGSILIYMIAESILLVYAFCVGYGVAIYSQVGFSLISIFSLTYLFVRHNKLYGEATFFEMISDKRYFN